MRNIVNLILRAIRSRIYLDESFILYEYHHHFKFNPPVELKTATENNLNDVLYFDSKRNFLSMKKMLKQGEKGLLGYIDGKCVHRSWYKDNRGKALIFKFLPIFLEENEVYIHDCSTSSEMRGRNIYPYVLSCIASNYNEGNKILISTNVDNIASRR
ncbi:MAG: hypothetical protein K8R35_06735, partial [Bacteroidales bacterium]|nr:hypothetical protein [Bacteroidales bacterium]